MATSPSTGKLRGNGWIMTFDVLLGSQFTSIHDFHILHSLLPPESTASENYSLRPRVHNLQLPWHLMKYGSKIHKSRTKILGRFHTRTRSIRGHWGSYSTLAYLFSLWQTRLVRFSCRMQMMLPMTSATMTTARRQIASTWRHRHVSELLAWITAPHYDRVATRGLVSTRRRKISPVTARQVCLLIVEHRCTNDSSTLATKSPQSYRQHLSFCCRRLRRHCGRDLVGTRT